MARWLDRAPTGRPARRYDLAIFGLNRYQLREEFRHYTDRFCVELESD
jgi:hypothetical protein